MTSHPDNRSHDTNAARTTPRPKALITGASSGIGAIYADRLARRGYDLILNLSSAVALAHEWINGVYSGTKAYVLNLTRKMHQELNGKGIRVQAVLPGAVRTDMWEKAGTDVASISPDILMDAGDMVDAALAGLDRGEVVTIPSLEHVADWEAFEAARAKLLPQLSTHAPAARYRIAVVGASA